MKKQNGFNVAVILLFLFNTISVSYAQTSEWSKLSQTGKNAFKQGNYAEAEKAFLSAKEIADKSEHNNEHLALTINDLSILYGTEGKYNQAEDLSKQFLALREKSCAPDDVRLAAPLAMIYKKQAKYAEAEALYKRCLAIMEKAYGANDPRVAITLDNLALLYEAENKFDLAAPLSERSLAIEEKVLGLENIDVAITMDNLGIIY